MTDYFYKNADADECIFVHVGSGILKTMYGDIRFEYGDYLVIPRGTIYQLEFDTTDNRLFIVESSSPILTPKRYRNDFGQLMEHSPFCERDIRKPTDLETFDEKGNFLFKVELGGYKQLFDKGLNMNEILPLGMAVSHMKTIKLSFLKKVGLNSNYFSIPGVAGCQDYDFALRSLLNNCKFQYLDRALYNHRWHSKSITINNNGQQTQLRDMVQRLFQVRRYLSNIQLINNKPKPETRRKHVLFIVPYLVTGGAERWLLNLSSFLKSQKYLVTIFTTNGSGEWEQKAKHVCDNLIINNVETETQENVIQKLIDYVNTFLWI